MKGDLEAYEFTEAGAEAAAPVDHGAWPVGEAVIFLRVKVRNEAGEHIADGYVPVERAEAITAKAKETKKLLKQRKKQA